MKTHLTMDTATAEQWIDKLERYALDHYDEHRDDLGDINLTALGEAAFIEFDMTEAEWQTVDGDFIIWRILDKKGLLTE